MEAAITSLLANNPAVAALAGNRINWALRPGAVALPAVSLHRISGVRDRNMTGRTGLVSSTVQVDCYGGTYGQAKALARAVILALPHAQTEIGGVILQGIFPDQEADSFEGDDPTPLYRTRLDFSVWHSEPQGG